MGHRIERPSRAAAVAAIAALMAAASAAALPIHLPGHHAKATVPTEGPWIVHAGQVHDIYANTEKKPLALLAYFCVTPGASGAPRVDLQQVGRSPIELQGCQSLYLLLAPGDRIALADPGPTDATGTYKLDLQGQLK